MAQDIELKFDDDNSGSTEKLRIESDEAKPIINKTESKDKLPDNTNIPEEKPADTGNAESINIDVGQNKDIEISDDTAYKAGVLTIGIPIILVMIIIGTTTYNPKEKAKSSKSEIQEEEVIVETSDVDYEGGSENEDSSESNTSEQGSGFVDADTHVVEPGETLYSIGLDLEIDWKQLAEINGIEPPYDLKSGQELQLPQ